MAKLWLVVLTNPVEGREDEYNEWYSGRHLEDVLAVDCNGCNFAVELVGAEIFLNECFFAAIRDPDQRSGNSRSADQGDK